jgi:hypothetical protein
MAFCRQNFKPPASHVFANSGAIIGSAVPVTQLVYSLSPLLDRPVIDKTNLKGRLISDWSSHPSSVPHRAIRDRR